MSDRLPEQLSDQPLSAPLILHITAEYLLSSPPPPPPPPHLPLPLLPAETLKCMLGEIRSWSAILAEYLSFMNKSDLNHSSNSEMQLRQNIIGKGFQVM